MDRFVESMLALAMRAVLAMMALLALFGLANSAQANPKIPGTLGTLATLFEQSGYQETGRYEEVVRLCDGFQKSFPGRALCRRFGMTPEGRPLLALIASADGVLEEAAAKKAGRPVVFFQGGIHAGEIDGKDAGFLVLRELLSSRDTEILGRVTAVFVPVFNVDGHERFGRNNRPNQIGPKEMGFRTTARNLNLNRDYTKIDTEEMAAMLPFLHGWDPILYIDLHVTDGADFQPDIAVMIEPLLSSAPALRTIGLSMRETVFGALRAKGHLPLPFYPAFERTDEPSSGFAMGVAPPRFSNSYWSLHHRFGILVETHAWKDYKRRVAATANTLRALLALTAKEGHLWLATARNLDGEAARGAVAGTEVPLLYDHTDKLERLPFPGYAYTIEPSPVSGALRVKYDPRKKQIWDLPFFPEIRPVVSVRAPRAGYLVPVAHAGWVLAKLRLHGLRFSVLSAPAKVKAEEFVVTHKKFRSEPYESRMTVDVKGEVRQVEREVPAGSLYVPIAQEHGILAVHLLEATAPDSFLYWGFFNAQLEQKEYMEAYVAETVAEEMLRKDGSLRAEFARRLRTDPSFARDPAARLRFFHERHPSWDERYDRYPVLRLHTAPK